MTLKHYEVNALYAGPELDIRVQCLDGQGQPLRPGLTLFLLPGERVRCDDARAQEALESLVFGRKDGRALLVEIPSSTIHVDVDANAGDRRRLGADEQRRIERLKPHGPPRAVAETLDARGKKRLGDAPAQAEVPMPIHPDVPHSIHWPTRASLLLTLLVALAVLLWRLLSW